MKCKCQGKVIMKGISKCNTVIDYGKTTGTKAIRYNGISTA